MRGRVLVAGFAGICLVAIAAGTESARSQPVEYVKICDAYGANWYYSPGTDTCINTMTGETITETPGGTVVGETELRQRLDSIESRIDRAFAEQASVAAALADPDLVAGEHFGVRINWGNAGEANAFGFSGAAVLKDHVFGDTGRLTGSAGIAFSGGTVGGRAGLQLTW